MNDYFFVCCSTNDKNNLSDFIKYSYSLQNKLTSRISKKNINKLKIKMDYTHVLVNNGKQEYFLRKNGYFPRFNEVKNSYVLSHTYWRTDKKETNGFQNLCASVKLMIKCLDCAEKQKLDIKHCHCINMLSKHDLSSKSNSPIKLRLLSLNVLKNENGHFNRDTSILYGEYELFKKDIENTKFLL